MATNLWLTAATAVIATCFLFANRCESQLVLKKGAPHVKLDQGSYIGTVRSTRQEGYFYEFLGLRYAEPQRRFEPPEPVATGNTKEASHATKVPPICPQVFAGDILVSDEDCLFLNVFVPKRESPKDGFPVIVWFHGGAFMFGSGAAREPEYMMDEDVILVTVNYRLGALGFLSTGDSVVPGNLGLKDQVLALKWVQKNIKHFSGDNKLVTICGNSAGGASVHYLMLSPLAKGLFHNAIMQSGSAASFWAFDERPIAISKAKDLSGKLGCPIETSTEMVDCLKSKSVREILSAQTQLYKWFANPAVPFSPTIEDVIGSSDMVFLADHPMDLLESKEFTKVPILTGYVLDEGLSYMSATIIKSEQHMKELNSDFLKVAPIAFEYSSAFPAEHLDTVSSAIREFYFGDKSINQETFQNLTNLYSDSYFIAGIWKSILAHATEKPVYAYVFSFIDESSNSLTQLVTGDKELLGVAHADELQYLFRVKDIFPLDIPQSPRAVEFSKRLVKLWASFAKHRKPKATWGSAEKWPSISKAQLNGDKPFLFYELNEDTKILENPFMERKQFWEKLIKKYSKRSMPKKDEL